jgi:hypothetical protein
MRKLLGLGLIVFASGLADTSAVAQSVPTRSVTLQELTVPQDRLPEGCTLKVIEPSRREVLATPAAGVQTVRFVSSTSSMQPRGVTLNPWTGTDRRILAELRQRVDGFGPVRMPDAPPLSSSETSAMLLQFADDVAEGYAATYAQSDGREIGVWAVRFATAVPPDRSPLPLGRRSSARTFDIGLIRATLLGDNGACAAAIETHVKSLGK